MKPSASVIISTYNKPKWLEKVLFGYEHQSVTEFEILIADDGSATPTEEVINRFIERGNLQIIHVWQADDGFQKTKILNKALTQCTANYIVCTDGDCIPRHDFVETHLNLRRKGYFLSGGNTKLPLSVSEIITEDDIKTQRCFDKQWLLNHGVPRSFKLNKLTKSRFLRSMLNTFTTTKATWDGCNASGWKTDIFAVNGFDERMAYGGEDRELGERLMNNDIRPLQIRYSAICLHLDHERPYVDKTALEQNKAIRKRTKDYKKTWTNFGIVRN